MREIERKDIFGRVSSIAVYNGAKVEKINEITYSDNSFNPANILYKKDINNALVPIRQEEYIYQYKNLKTVIYYVYNNKKKIKTGWIDYTYNSNNLKNISYYVIDDKTSIPFMFAFDSYDYDENYKLTSRRFIEYDLQSDKNETTQTAQYVFIYENGDITEMKTWILDKKSKKIIEKKEINRELVNMVIRNIEESCNTKVRGRDFNK
jgi:hypothetical protein